MNCDDLKEYKLDERMANFFNRLADYKIFLKEKYLKTKNKDLKEAYDKLDEFYKQKDYNGCIYNIYIEYGSGDNKSLDHLIQGKPSVIWRLSRYFLHLIQRCRGHRVFDRKGDHSPFSLKEDL